jgi:carbon storage regulator
MLVISRKAKERIRIGKDIVVVINRIRGGKVSIGIEAPSEVRIVRGELVEREGGTQRDAA